MWGGTTHTNGMNDLSDYFDEVPINQHPGFNKPVADWGGKSLSDFWDEEAKAFTEKAPIELLGVTHFIKPKQ